MNAKLKAILNGVLCYVKDRTKDRFMKLLDKICPDKKDQVVRLLNEDKIEDAVKIIMECITRD